MLNGLSKKKTRRSSGKVTRSTTERLVTNQLIFQEISEVVVKVPETINIYPEDRATFTGRFDQNRAKAQ